MWRLRRHHRGTTWLLGSEARYSSRMRPLRSPACPPIRACTVEDPTHIRVSYDRIGRPACPPIRSPGCLFTRSLVETDAGLR